MGIRSFSLLACALCAAGCSLTRSARGPDVPERMALSQEDSIEFTRLFFDAIKEKMLGNYNKAAALYADCVRKNPRAGAAMYELSRIYLLQGRNDQALYFAQGAANSDGENSWYQLLLGEVLEKNKRYSEAAKVYAKMLENDPFNAGFSERLANAYVQLGDYRQAIALYDELEKQWGVQEDIALKKERLYILSNRVDKAAAEIRKLIRTYPGETRFFHLLADLYMANNMEKEALEIYRELLEMQPDNPLALLSMADFFRKSGEESRIFPLLSRCFENPAMEAETKCRTLYAFFPYAVVLRDSVKLQEALALADIIARVHRNDAQALSAFADYLYQNNETERAREQYRAALTIGDGQFQTWRKLLAIESELQDYPSMLKESRSAMELFPAQPVFYLFCGIALIHLGDNAEAITVLRKGIDLTSAETPLLADFYANLGDTYYKNRDTLASYGAFDKALEIDPDNRYVLNNYSFYLALRGEELEKARKMAERAVALEPDNFSFLDTYGWIFYRLGKFQDAKKMIESALEKGGEKRPAILEHYGDVLYKLGDRQKALEYWKKAEDIGAGSPLLKKKIADKMLCE